MTRELVPEYVLELLPAEARRQFEGELARSAELTAEVRDAQQALLSLNDALPTEATPPGGRARLMVTLSGPRRFQSFFPLLQTWFDLDDTALAKVLAEVDGGKAWLDAPLPGVQYFHFQTGPGSVVKEAGCVRLIAGGRFPRHLHHGVERALILEGTLLLGARAWYPGDVIEASPGTAHEFAAAPGRDLVFIVGHDGISFSA